jgi:hypothetical protein
MVDEKTQLKLSSFFETTNAMLEPTREPLNKWKNVEKKLKE